MRQTALSTLARACLVLWCCGLFGCPGSEQPATGVLVAVHADPAMAARLRVIKARLFAPDAAEDAAPADELTFAVGSTTRPRTGDVALPFSFGVQQGSLDGFLLQLVGYGTATDVAIVEQKMRVRFQPRQTVLVEGFFSSACSEHVCTSLWETCSASQFRCIPVADATTREVSPGDELATDASQPEPHDGGGVDAAPEAAVTAPDAMEPAPVPPPDAALPVPPPLALRSDLTLLLRLDEPQWTPATRAVRDQSGLDNHGEVSGSARPTRAARLGGAASLDGAGYIEVADAPSLQVAGAFAVSAWFQLDQLPGARWPGIVSKRVAYNVETAFALFLSPDNRIAVDVAGEESRFESQARVETQRWHHVALVFDGALPMNERVRLYVDGVLDTTSSEPSSEVPPSSAALQVGNLPNGGDTFIGRIDELALWRRALSASEVAALYQQPASL